MQHCPNCGSDIYQGESYCEGCGKKLEDVGEASEGSNGVPEGDSLDSSTPSKTEATASNETPEKPSDTFFAATVAFSVAQLFFLVLSFLGSPIATILIFVCFIGSIVTMALDIFKVDDQVWDTNGVFWTCGAVALWIVVMPAYLIRRHQAVKKSMASK